MTGLLSQARLFVVLGRERLLPARLAAVHPTTNTPVQATVLTGLCAGALALVLDINVLAELVSVGTLYVFYSVCAGVIFRRFYFPSPGSSPKRVLVKIAAVTVTAMGTSLTYTYEAPWPVLAACAGCWLLATVALCTQKIMRQPARFSMPLFPITPSLGILFTIHLLCSLGWPAYVRFAVWMVLGAVVYALYGAGAADQHEAETRRQRKETGDVAARQNGGAEMQLVERNLSTLEPERPLGMAVGEESWLLQGKNGS